MKGIEIMEYLLQISNYSIEELPARYALAVRQVKAVSKEESDKLNELVTEALDPDVLNDCLNEILELGEQETAGGTEFFLEEDDSLFYGTANEFEAVWDAMDTIGS